MSELVLIVEEIPTGGTYYILTQKGIATAYVGTNFEGIKKKWEGVLNGGRKHDSLKKCLTYVNRCASSPDSRVGVLTIIGRGKTLEEVLNQAKLWEILE